MEEEKLLSASKYWRLALFFSFSLCAREVSLEELFFVVKEDGLNYAFSGISPAPSISVTRPGSRCDLKGKWRSSIRVSLEEFIPAPFWCSFLTYTHIGSDSKGEKTASPGSAIRKRWDSPHFFEDDLERAEGRWSLGMNIVDLGLKGDVKFDCGMALEPFFGLKGTWQKQGYHVTYVSSQSEFPTTVKMDHRERFTGVGPVFGTSLIYAQCPCVRWIGKGAISALVGEFHVDRSDILTELTPTPDTTVTLVESSIVSTVVPVLELFAGVEVDYCQFSFRIGWEQQVWWGMNRLIKIGSTSEDGGSLLTMQGLTFRLSTLF